MRLRPANHDLLRSIAQLSGGKLEPRPPQVFEPTARTARRPIPLWPYLALAAALLFVADVAFRRIDFSLLFDRFRGFRAQRRNSLFTARV